MPVVTASDKFLSALRKSGLLTADQIDGHLAALPAGADPTTIARRFIKAGLLTKFQARCLGEGKGHTLIVANKYKILDFLGDGGMGQVYLAEHLLMKRRVALKVPPARKLADPARLARFIREARVLAALDHPNIVRAHDLEQFGKLYMLAMEYVDGPNLSTLVADHGRRPTGQAAHYIAQAAQGLQHAHEAGWVHRDIKPANLLVDPTGVVKVLDLGLAFLLGDEAESLTRKYDENAVLGTADYLAPEQAIDSHDVDIRADIYSLGATFYYLLTGRTMFDCATVTQKLMAHQVTDPPPVADFRPDMPAGLQAVLTKMIAKDRDHRYQTPAEVAQALLPFATDGNLAPPSRAGKSAPPRRTGEQPLASTVHARSRSGATTRKLVSPLGARVRGWLARRDWLTRRDWRPKAIGTWARQLATHPDWRVKAGAGAGVAAVLLLTGLLSAYVFRGHTVAAGAPVGPTLTPAAPKALVAGAGERLVFQAHTGPAESVRILPDGRFVTGGDDKLIRVWDPTGRQVLRQLHGHTETLRGLTLVPGDSRLAVSTARDASIRLWDIDAGIEVRKFVGHVGQVWWADVSPDCRQILSCGADKTVRVWNLQTGKQVRKMVGHTDGVTFALFLPDGRRAVSCGHDKTVRLWDTQAGVELNSYRLPAVAYRMSLTPDGRRAVVGSRAAVHVWDVESGMAMQFETPMEAKAFIEHGRFSPDGRWLLAGGSDGTVHIWDTLTSRELPLIRASKGKVLDVLWAADGRSFVVTCADGTVHVWDWPRGV
jgi:eukaryotic-like serine/threonine-protein kinase